LIVFVICLISFPVCCGVWYTPVALLIETFYKQDIAIRMPKVPILWCNDLFHLKLLAFLKKNKIVVLKRDFLNRWGVMQLATQEKSEKKYKDDIYSKINMLQCCSNKIQLL